MEPHVEPDNGRGRILLIDDNEQGLLARRIILEGLGYEVATAESGEGGIQRFAQALDESAGFDLVVTDYRMPGMRGDEVIQRLRALAPEVRVIMLSGYALPLALTPDSTGAQIVLAKGPREQYELAEAVERILSDGPARRRKPPASEVASATGRPIRRRRRAGAR